MKFIDCSVKYNIELNRLTFKKIQMALFCLHES